jgi:hypothetical protein
MRRIAFIVLVSCLTFGQDLSKLHVRVKELPPEPIPVGTCKESYSGYLEIQEHGKVKDSNLTSQQIGDYINKRLSEGYSLSLYPQASGRLFIIETCQSTKD